MICPFGLSGSNHTTVRLALVISSATTFAGGLGTRRKKDIAKKGRQQKILMDIC